MKKYPITIILLLAVVAMQVQAQDLAHYKTLVKQLSSAKYQGRGYAKGGANKAGKMLEKEYKKAGVDEVTLQPFTIDTLSLQPTKTEGILMLPGQSHIIPKISSALYVRKDKEGVAHLLNDNRQPAESMANLLVADSETTADAMIQLEFVLDNYRKDTLQVSLADWKAFMRSQGCQPYFGYEGVSKGEVTGTLLLANPQSGYDHILHVSCPTDAIGQEGMMLRATAYLFTPLSNVKALFGNPTSNTSRKSIIVWK